MPTTMTSALMNAYAAGFDTSEQGEPRECPYEAGDLADAWLTGYDKAQDAAREADERANDAHEQAAERARGNDFEDTDGKDWT